ncbi:hypothetical protein CPB83DRAFT_852512 [Crepidotus variabilis]|uniref:Uncharacterized protein n=1 Tax=Crepidotus variabilis TaxID=179855 RepID=A0A9P6EI69_9AGAR|nr:hypothetical protein CPB83DRAFT_852512 [Crepidotus variabilis]
MAVIAGLLHHLPQLQTVWAKTINWVIGANLSGPTIRKSKKNLFDVRIPITLNHVRHLAITAPGTGTDILLCLDAPALYQVHLDGTRGHLFDNPYARANLIWSRAETGRVQSSLKRLASRSPNLRHLALTATYLSEECWTWLLLGSTVEPPPFHCLESLALHELDSQSGKVACGFTEAGLLRYSMRSDISLRKLSFRRCTFSIDGAVLVQVFINFIQQRPSNSFTLEIDDSFKGITDDHLDRLRLVGVVVRNIGRDVPGWWSHGHQIDALDSTAY